MPGFKFDNHYEWLSNNINKIFNRILDDELDYKGLISAHGDKCYQYRDLWKKSGVPFNHGVALYLLTYVYPYSLETRDTFNGWVQPEYWVIENYQRFLHYFPMIHL